MSFFVRVPGSCGELAQGWIDGVRLHISCPVNRYAWAFLEGKGSMRRPLGIKTRKALHLAEALFRKAASAVPIALSSDLPVGKGMASSTADLVAALALYQMTTRSCVDLDLTARLALAVEPTDGVIFQGVTLFDHTRGSVLKPLGSPPPLDIVAIEFEEVIDTVSFNEKDQRRLARAQTGTILKAFQLVEEGLRERSLQKIGEGVTLSALAHQNFLRKPELEKILRFTFGIGGVGVNVAHSGSMIGMLFRPGSYSFTDVRRRVRDLLRRPLTIHPLKLRGGGIEALVQPV